MKLYFAVSYFGDFCFYRQKHQIKISTTFVNIAFIFILEQRALVADEDEPVTKLEREMSKHLEKGKQPKDLRTRIQHGHKDLLQIQQHASRTEVTRYVVSILTHLRRVDSPTHIQLNQ